jgi:hypothetical protein
MQAGNQSRIVLSELGAAVAIMICFAVVLGVGEISHTGKPETARAHAALTVSSAPVVSASMAVVPLVPERLADAEPASPQLALQVEAAAAPAEPAAADEPRGGPFVPVTPGEAATTTMPLGVWAPDGTACSLREFRQGMLPTIINSDGAWAGETFCTFRNQKPTDDGWRVVATCSNGTGHWTNEVRLSVKGERLVWSSRRGTQIYTRCGPDFLLAGRDDLNRR